MDPIVSMEAELAELEAERRERQASLPAHSIRPHQLLVLEELDERIAELRGEIARVRAEGAP